MSTSEPFLKSTMAEKSNDNNTKKSPTMKQKRNTNKITPKITSNFVSPSKSPRKTGKPTEKEKEDSPNERDKKKPRNERKTINDVLGKSPASQQINAASKTSQISQESGKSSGK